MVRVKVGVRVTKMVGYSLVPELMFDNGLFQINRYPASPRRECQCFIFLEIQTEMMFYQECLTIFYFRIPYHFLHSQCLSVCMGHSLKDNIENLQWKDILKFHGFVEFFWKSE